MAYITIISTNPEQTILKLYEIIDTYIGYSVIQLNLSLFVITFSYLLYNTIDYIL